MDEPKEGATTMKKKAQEKLAAKANPAPVVSEETSAEVVAEVPAEVATTDVVVEAVAEAPAEAATTDVVVEAPATEEAAE
jgi:small subunit ribosomal protein S16